MDKYIFGKNTNIYFEEHLFFLPPKICKLAKISVLTIFCKTSLCLPSRAEDSLLFLWEVSADALFRKSEKLQFQDFLLRILIEYYNIQEVLYI